VVRLGGAARVAGDPLAPVEDRYRGRRQEDVDPLLQQPVRHRIEVAVDGDVVVDIDPRREPLADDKRLRRQRFELAALDRLEQRAPSRGGANGRLLNSSTFSASAVLASASENSCRCRSGASAHLSTSRTAFSAVGLSRGLRTRAGTIATP